MSALKSYRLPWRLFRNYSTPSTSSTCTSQPEPKGLWSRRFQKDPELEINKMLQNNESYNSDKWLNIRNELLNSKFKLSEINIDAVIIDTCNDFNNKNAALSYTNFLIKNNFELNMATIGKYFKLLSALERDLTEDETDRIIKMYDDMRKRYPLLDAASAESAALALSRTERWKDAVELIDMIKLTTIQPKSTVLSSICSAAFDHNEEDLGFQCLNAVLPRLWPTEKPYQSYLSYCKRTSNTPEILEQKIVKMFEFWKEHGIHPWVKVLDEYADALKSTGWMGRSTTVKLTGMCCNCKQTLETLKLTPKDFKRLSDIVMNQVLVGKDIYCKTTPEELEKFKRFIDETSPYDVVVDGLNAAYTLRNRNDHLALGNELANVVKAFKDQRKKVLVLGRHHMSQWRGPGMNYVRNNAHMFLANNLSEDDPYLLYATLKSGLNTYFSSKDLMRQHKYLFKDPSALKLFRMWQMTRQVMPRYVGDRRKNTLVLIYPPSYVPIAQLNDNNWHLPCTQENTYGTPTDNDNEPPKMWYCLQKNKTKG